MNSKNALSKTRMGKAWPRTIIVELVKGEQLPRIEDNRENERKNKKVQLFHHKNAFKKLCRDG
jgi:hypothetical protein